MRVATFYELTGILTAVQNQQKSTTDPIGGLALLGWAIKTDKSLLTFEIANKPLPNMEASATYFKALHKPFKLHLQSVPSIAGFKFLSGVSTCVELEIYASDLPDTSELKYLKSLTTLTIQQTPFTTHASLDITSIGSLVNLKTLSFPESPVASIEPLRALHQLTKLDLSGPLIRDLTPIRDLKALKVVGLGDTRVTNLSPLANDKALEELLITGNQAGSLSALASLGGLKTLRIYDQRVVDLSQVGSLRNLESLVIWGPLVMDIGSLRNLGHLKSLEIMSNNYFPGLSSQRSQILNVDSIGALTELKKLKLMHVQLTSLGFVIGCNNLTELWLDDLPVGSISELSTVLSLRKVSLIEIPVVEISPLLSLPNLETLSIVRTPARADVISELEKKGVKVEIN